MLFKREVSPDHSQSYSSPSVTQFGGYSSSTTREYGVHHFGTMAYCIYHRGYSRCNVFLGPAASEYCHLMEEETHASHIVTWNCVTKTMELFTFTCITMGEKTIRLKFATS